MREEGVEKVGDEVSDLLASASVGHRGQADWEWRSVLSSQKQGFATQSLSAGENSESLMGRKTWSPVSMPPILLH